MYDFDRECQLETAEFDAHAEAEWPHNSSFQVKRGINNHSAISIKENRDEPARSQKRGKGGAQAQKRGEGGRPFPAGAICTIEK
jgi:hypothetical protein